MSSRSFAPFLRKLRDDGYAIRLFYVMQPSAAEAHRRVQRRVKTGGHHIPRDVVQRRFGRSAANLFELYMPLANNWAVHENLTDALPAEVARGARRRAYRSPSGKFMAKASKDRKERLTLSTPEIKRALKAAALKNNKIGVALGVAKPIRRELTTKSTGRG